VVSGGPEVFGGDVQERKEERKVKAGEAAPEILLLRGEAESGPPAF
jgi:hypothetical protein